MKNFSHKFNTGKNFSRGFTLVELVVTVGIFAFISGIVLSNYRQYIGNAGFANSAESLLFAVKEAQVYGSSTKQNSIACGTDFFGCSFGVSVVTGGTNFIVFADINNNAVYESGEEVKITNFPSGTLISTVSCTGGCPSGVSITFKRPNPDAFIAGVANQAVSYQDVFITLTNGSSKNRTLKVLTSGQVSFE